MHYLYLIVIKEVATTKFIVIYLIYWHGISKRRLVKLDNATALPASQTIGKNIANSRRVDLTKCQ